MTTPSITDLAVKAIEAKTKASAAEWQDDDLNISADNASTDFYSATITPEAWLALRNEVLEECAEMFESMHNEAAEILDGKVTPKLGTADIAPIIRALKQQRPA